MAQVSSFVCRGIRLRHPVSRIGLLAGLAALAGCSELLLRGEPPQAQQTECVCELEPAAIEETVVPEPALEGVDSLPACVQDLTRFYTDVLQRHQEVLEENRRLEQELHEARERLEALAAIERQIDSRDTTPREDNERDNGEEDPNPSGR